MNFLFNILIVVTIIPSSIGVIWGIMNILKKNDIEYKKMSDDFDAKKKRVEEYLTKKGKKK